MKTKTNIERIKILNDHIRLFEYELTCDLKYRSSTNKNVRERIKSKLNQIKMIEKQIRIKNDNDEKMKLKICDELYKRININQSYHIDDIRSHVHNIFDDISKNHVHENMTSQMQNIFDACYESLNAHTQRTRNDNNKHTRTHDVQQTTTHARMTCKKTEM